MTLYLCSRCDGVHDNSAIPPSCSSSVALPIGIGTHNPSLKALLAERDMARAERDAAVRERDEAVLYAVLQIVEWVRIQEDQDGCGEDIAHGILRGDWRTGKVAE